MKENPLIKALGNRKKDDVHGVFQVPEMPRMLDLKTSELPDLKDSRIGDEVTAYFTGKVKSMHDDGRVVVEVSGITPDDEEEKTMIVRSDTSPTPS